MLSPLPKFHYRETYFGELSAYGARVINSALQAHSMGSLPGEPKYGYILKLGIFNDILIIIFMYRIVVHEV